MNDLPIKLVVEINCTNFSTMREALIAAANGMGQGSGFPVRKDELQDARFPGTVCWKLRVRESVFSLEEHAEKLSCGV